MSNQFWTSEELRAMSIKCGDKCLIHKTTILVNAHNLKLGSNVRIDGFSVISAGIGITIGSNVHVAGYVSLFGGAGIEVDDYASIASGAKVYSISDDVNGRGLVGPCVPDHLRHLHKGRVVLGAHSVLSINTSVMPGAHLPEGATLLPYSTLMKQKEELLPFSIYSGVPAKWIKAKEPRLKELVNQLEADEDNSDGAY